MRPINIFFFSCLWALFFTTPPCLAGNPKSPFNHLISNGGFIITSGDSTILEDSSDIAFIPASTIKIATALVALEVLGPHYRFRTDFFVNNHNQLFIKGYGDPFLTSEYVEKIAEKLSSLGVKKVDELVIDTNLFDISSDAYDGSKISMNPYDAPNGPCAVNFNSVPLIKHKDNHLNSGEQQTPMLPLMKEIASNLEPGIYRLNVSYFAPDNKTDYAIRYTAELFTALLNEKGIKTSGLYRRGTVNNSAELIYTYVSGMSLKEVVQACLTYSNNFIANQLFLTCGAKLFGYPATWEKGILAMKKTLAAHVDITTNDTEIFEGSGLSRKNRITPLYLLSILKVFKPYAHLLANKDGILLKSGTMDGVYCYAGYFSPDTTRDPFVILLNQTDNTRDHVLKELYNTYLARRLPDVP